MSFGFGIGDILTIIELAISTGKKFASAPAHFRGIATDVQNLSSILQNVRDFLASSRISDSERSNLEEALAACRRVLVDVEQAILRYSKLTERHGSLRTRTWRIWHKTTYEPNDVRDMRSQISSSLSLLSTLLSRYTRDDVRLLVKSQEMEHKQRIIAWLPLSGCAAQHADHVRRRLSGTGQWLLRADFYQKFKCMKGETVLLVGIPGVGKTVLASTVIDDLRALSKSNERVGICYHYCDYTRQEEQQLDSILLSLVRQLVMVSPNLPNKVQEMCEQHDKTNTWPALNEIEDAVSSIIVAFQRTYIVVDAVDEYPPADNARSIFLLQLMKLQKRTGVNLLFTSRPLLDVKQSLGKHISADIRASDEDIGSYVENQIGGFPSSVQNNTDLYHRIKQSTIKAADGIFLLATLHLKSVQGQLTAYAVEKMLRKLDMDGLDSSKLYMTTMDRICGQEHQRKELGINTLTWIVYAQRPLRSDELLHALAVDTEASEFHHTNIVDIKQVEAACHGLVYVEEETQIIRLIHRTAQEFLKEHGSKWLVNPHAMISKTCTAYLSFIGPEGQGSQMRPGLVAHLTQFCLYEYASWHWEYHTMKREDESSALDFAITQGQVETSSRKLIQFTVPEYLELSQKHPGIQGLHLLAYCGLTAFMPQFLEKYDINVFDEFGKTPIAYALERGQWEAARLLIERGVNLDYAHNSGITSLHLAIKSGQERMVKLVINAGVSLNSTDPDGWTPLHYAVKLGEESIVRLLIDSGASINTTDPDGWTPLHYAVKLGEESMVRLLIDSGASINATNSDGKTSLHLACIYCKQESKVRLLIDGGASINATDSNGKTPLYHVSLQGRENVARLLIDGGASINAADSNGRTPLHAASLAGKDDIVRLLIDSGASINVTDFDGKTPLHVACESYDDGENVARLLIDSGASINTTDSDGYTPLHTASLVGKENVVRLLIASGASINTTDSGGWTPLHCAVKFARERIVRLLIDTGASINATDSEGRTPLHLAIYWERENVARLLIDSGASINATDSDGRTPLRRALQNRLDDLATMLVRRGATKSIADIFGGVLWFFDRLYGDKEASTSHCNSCTQDNKFQNCICECSKLTDRRISKALVDMVLEQGFEVNQTDEHGRSPLSHAMGNGCQCLVYKLIDHGAEIDTIDNQGRGSLSYAAESGNAILITLCLAKSAEIDSVDYLSRTPLSYAAESGSIEAVQKLLEAKASVDSKDKGGRTPLSYAAASRNVELARLLIDEGAEVDIFDEHRRAPIFYAATVEENGATVQMLYEKGARINERDEIGVSPLLLAYIRDEKNPILDKLWATASEEEKVLWLEKRLTKKTAL